MVAVTLSQAEFYKYVDKDGNILFTDDLSRIPSDQRHHLGRYDDAPASPDRFARPRPHATPANCPLGWRDIQLTEKLIEMGVIPPDYTCPPERDLRFIANMLEKELGVSDILSWQADPRYASPEQTWQVHVEAMISGDLDQALACFLPKRAAKQRQIFSAIGRQQLQEMATAMETIQVITKSDDRAKFRIRRRENHGGKAHTITYYIYFANVFGEWKIDKY
jgi:hypothetical protein